MNRVQLCGLVCADPDISIHKSGVMRARFLLKTYSNWQAELGAWEYCEDTHLITVYKEELVYFLQEKVNQGDQLFVQGYLTYNESHELSPNEARYVHILVPRKQGLIFQVKNNQNLKNTKFISEFANENKPSESIDEIE